VNKTVIQAILASKEVSVDTETDSLNALRCRLKGVSLAWTSKGREWSHYWNFNSDDMPSSVATDKWEKFRRVILEPLFNRRAVVLVFHNASYDLKVFRARNLQPKTTRISDTMIMDFLLNENRPHDLKTCAVDHLKAEGTKSHGAIQKEIIGLVKGAQTKIKRISTVAWESYRDYHKGILTLDQVPAGYVRNLITELPDRALKQDVVNKVVQEVGATLEAQARKQGQRIFNDYARKDALWTLQLHKHLLPKIQEEGFGQIYWNLYQSVMLHTVEMEVAGIKVSIPGLKKIRDLLQKQLAVLEGNIRRRFGRDFNPASAPQVKQMLWRERKLTPPPWLKTRDLGVDGLPGSGEDIIEWLVEEGHEFLQDLLVRRKLSKTLSTYILPLIEEAELDPEGRIHTSFSIIKRTSRWSSSNPNLQNIPRWDTLKRYIPDCPSIRECFIAEKGNTLLVGDYSQCDLRVMAHATGDPAFLKSYRTWKCGACRKQGETNKPFHKCPACGEPDEVDGGVFVLGEDIHRETGLATGLIKKLGEKDGRQEAKEVNFGATYLMGAPTLAKKLGLTLKEAKVVLQGYHDKHVGIRHFSNLIFQRVAEQGYFLMLNGQKRRFDQDFKKLEHADRTVGPNGQSDYTKLKYAIMRELMNNVGQGGTAVIINTAVYLLWKRREFLLKHQCRLLLQVHDEVVLEVPTKYAKKVKKWLRNTMEDAGQISVPVLADVGQGKTWQTAK